MSRLFVILLIGASQIAVACHGDYSSLPKSELSIMGVAIDQNEETVLRVLGNPLKINLTNDYYDKYFSYKILDVYFLDGKVDYIVSDNKKACTPLGICPGATVKQVQGIYGKSRLTMKEGKSHMEYMVDGSECWLDLSIEGEFVDAIYVRCPV